MDCLSSEFDNKETALEHVTGVFNDTYLSIIRANFKPDATRYLAEKLRDLKDIIIIGIKQERDILHDVAEFAHLVMAITALVEK